MANINAPFGFNPTMRTLSGGNCSDIPAHKLVGYGTALNVFDAVTHAAAGTKISMAIDAAITPGTTPVLGVVLNWGAASTATDHIVILASGPAVFKVQGDGTGATFLVAASLSKNANIALTAGANKRSKHSLSETSIAGTNTLDLKIRGLWADPANVAGQYAKVLVCFNNMVDADQKAGL